MFLQNGQATATTSGSVASVSSMRSWFHALADVLLHEEPSAARAAAEALLPGARHLDLVDPLHRGDQRSGRVEDVVVPPEIAGVVIGDALVLGPLRRELAVHDQLREHLGVVHDLEVSAEVGVLVLERVQDSVGRR